MTLKAYSQVPIPSFMYGTAWKKGATAELTEAPFASVSLERGHAMLSGAQRPALNMAALR